MYLRNGKARNGRLRNGRSHVATRPLSMGGFWDELFASKPEVVVTAEQRAIMARWPADKKAYRVEELIPFLAALVDQAGAVLAKTADVTARRSIGPFGPSGELLDKIQGIETQIGKLAIKMGKRSQFATAKAKEGFTAIEFPELRADAFALMSLTHSLDALVKLEGGPSWIGDSLLAVVDAFTRTGAWLLRAGDKVARSFFALLSSGDIVIVGGLALLGLWWWKRGRQ